MRTKAARSGMHFNRQFRTLHSVALQMLRGKYSDAKDIVVPKAWQIRKVIRNTLNKFPGAKKTKKNPKGLSPSDVSNEVSMARTALVWPQEWVNKQTGQIFPSFPEWLDQRYNSLFVRALTACYGAVEMACENPHLYGFNASQERWLPFDAMIARTARDIIEGHDNPDCWTHTWRGRFSHVIVDEAQDNNHGQWVISQHLCSTQLTVCGDVAQSVFQFRGAQPAFLENFMDRKDFAVAPLTKNWRSGSKILDTANRVLSLLERRRDDNLRLGREGYDGTVRIDGVSDPRAEAEFIVDTVEKLVFDGIQYSDIAVLYRTNAYSANIEIEFIRRGIMCRIAGSSFFNTPIVRLSLDYLRCVRDPDSDAAFRGIYTKPLRGLGRAFLAQCPSYKMLQTVDLHSRWKKPAEKFLEHLTTLEEMLRTCSVGEALSYVFDVVGLRNFYRDEEADAEDETEIDEICKALISCASRISDIDTLLNMAAVLSGCGDDGEALDINAVTLSTAHAGKGLEWPVVFCAGVSAQLFPHKRAPRDEELRLGYVAFTRARDILHITYTRDSGPSELVMAACNTDPMETARPV
jgi:DNA helicase II / ATP-dependent DNA helicase PcrA